MAAAIETTVGTAVSLWRYPVKSMMGEELNSAEVTERGLLGDRVFAVVDRATGKVASAKEPRKWARLFEMRAAFVEPPSDGEIPPVRITLPDGEIVSSTQEDLDRRLSELSAGRSRSRRLPPSSRASRSTGLTSRDSHIRKPSPTRRCRPAHSSIPQSSTF